ncbi:zinc ribbon domain-containing protein [Azospirillum sp. RWY-5-1]|uniref:Zinc ribbon domain-containing protein n=1 Tax=Azospirillum oleiclasticum TaxID=2735135 RepID=A0ABX2TIH1_9PROT|nr:zinc ribbon domain-containing protein [Azospirillum oleiclasticum]NYZ16665.1 zinc ribbon domain-containing protein [Azospirillum oleiclasticum]NYZ24152.1 zinc ribbon domain-containing protein [Azospirillum oleiclasticum]
MPAYDYACAACGGDFTAIRPMAESAAPQPCPGCGASAPRVIRTAPAFSGLPAATRNAHTLNERSADRPALLSEGGRKHGPGCGCCGGSAKNARPVLRGLDGSKAFPTARPWMISH